MTEKELVQKICKLLKTDADLRFLLALTKEDLEKLLACIRDALDYR